MHVPWLEPSSDVWPRPKVWPTSWHITWLRWAGVLYCDMMKYVSFILAVPCTMWPLLSQIWAKPSQPFLPYNALQTSTRPLFGRHRLPVVLPATTSVSSTSE
jgi:hypothetical protein